MPRFSLHDWPDGDGLLVNLQSDFLNWLNTRIVAPLVPRGAAPPLAQHLNPVFSLLDREFVMLTQSIAAVPVAALGREVGTLAGRSTR